MINQILVSCLLIVAVPHAFATTTASEITTSTSATNNDAPNNTGLSLNVGTAGLGFDLTYSFDPSFKVRAGYNFASGSYTLNRSEWDMHGRLKTNNTDLLVDYYPWDEKFRDFRVTGGLDVINVNFKGHAEKNTTGSNNGIPYSSTKTVDVDAQWHGTKPYLGIGYDRFNSRKTAGFYLTADAGLIFSGSPKLNLTSTCISSNPKICAGMDQDTTSKKKQLKEDLDSIKLLPILQVGLGYRF